MAHEDDKREQIRSLLADGLPTEAFPRADTDDQVRGVTRRLQEAGLDLPEKLTIAGFTLGAVDHGEFQQSCGTCMYFLTQQRHCALPELDLPVEPEWCCRLWRI